MAKHRFFIAPDRWNPEALLLEGEEAHHCLEVLRCREGERIVVFNGAGAEAEAEVASATKGAVALRARLLSSAPRPPVSLTLAQAVPKGKNMDLIVQKATELGATRIVPLLSERTVVQLDGGELEKKREKWQRVAIEACKQCGQNWVPEVAAPSRVDSFVRQSRDPLRLIAAIGPEARPLKAILAARAQEGEAQPSAATLMVGPEGDFTPAELSTALSQGFLALSLGPIILRSETAAIYALSIAGHELQ
jgi:16S rRNA (uracil1498-N3)-methyltransferase